MNASLSMYSIYIVLRQITCGNHMSPKWGQFNMTLDAHLKPLICNMLDSVQYVWVFLKHLDAYIYTYIYGLQI